MKSLEMLNTHTYTTEKERNKSDIKASGENGTEEEENRRSAYGIRKNQKAKKRTRKRTRKEEKKVATNIEIRGPKK